MTWGEYIDEEVEEACKTARKEARAEALAEGRAEGERISLQNNILTVLSKLGTVSSSTEESINNCDDTELLKKWFVLAVNAESIQSFEQNMQKH